MKQISLVATRRENTGKGFARRARMAGNVPGIVYGPETEPIMINVNERSFRSTMRQAGKNTIINLQVDGKEHMTIVREIQRDPVSLGIEHVDFHAVSMARPIDISIPIRFEGTALGVRVDGGIQQITMRELEISCLPTDIPDEVVVDVTELGIGDAIHVRDLQLGNIRILSPEQRTVVVIAAPSIIKEAMPAAAAEEGEAAEGQAAEGEAKAEEAPAADAAKAKGEGAKAKKGE